MKQQLTVNSLITKQREELIEKWGAMINYCSSAIKEKTNQITNLDKNNINIWYEHCEMYKKMLQKFYYTIRETERQIEIEIALANKEKAEIGYNDAQQFEKTCKERSENILNDLNSYKQQVMTESIKKLAYSHALLLNQLSYQIRLSPNKAIEYLEKYKQSDPLINSLYLCCKNSKLSSQIAELGTIVEMFNKLYYTTIITIFTQNTKVYAL